MNLLSKKMFYITTVVVVASVIASSVIAVMTTDTSEKKEAVTNVSERKISYVVGEKDGRVTGFVKGVEVPYIRTDTAVDSLPYDVQQRIREGIEFEDEREMKQYLNEVCS